jgi:hypothetical protein
MKQTTDRRTRFLVNRELFGEETALLMALEDDD